MPKTLHSLFLLTALSLATTLPACDAGDAGHTDDASCPATDTARPSLLLAPPTGPVDEVAFREKGESTASYIQTWYSKPIKFGEFQEAIGVCAEFGDATWLLTLTGYKPDTTKDERVVGLGGSAYGSSKWWDCAQKHWAKNGAIDLP